MRSWGEQQSVRGTDYEAWRAARYPPIVLEVREVVEDVRIGLAFSKGETWVGEVAEHLLHVSVDSVERLE